MKFRENKNGITLIALIITIIVLLILAGVSITTLTGENGILNRATNAREVNDKASAREEIQLEVMASYGIDGNVDNDLIKENLSKINGITGVPDSITDSSYPLTVTVDGKTFEIAKSGTVTNKKIQSSSTSEIVSKIIANPEAYYGKKVTNYSAGNATYRIFYVDTENYFGDGKNTIYLKADFCDSTSLTTNLTYETMSAEGKAILEKQNQEWAANRLNETWNNNEKATAYLCEPDNFTKYKDTTGTLKEYVNYVIGAPGVEMYVKSYNSVPHTTNNYTLGATYRATSKPGYIYKLNGDKSTISNSDYYTGNDTLDYTGYNSMYCGKNGTRGSYYWWLASPCAYISNTMCHVDGYAGLSNGSCNDITGLSPLVSLKSNVTLEVEE